MANETFLLIDMIKALVRQGVPTKEDGVIVWSSCKYCNKSGWISVEKKGYPLVHEDGCFIPIAQKWLESKKEPEDVL